MVPKRQSASKKNPTQSDLALAKTPTKTTRTKKSPADSAIDFHALIDNLPNSILLFNKSGRCVHANQLYYTTFKRTAKTTIGQPMHTVIPSDLVPIPLLLDAIQRSENARKEINVPSRAYQDKFYRTHVSLLPDEARGESYTLLVIDDTSEQVIATSELQSRMDKLSAEIIVLREGAETIRQGGINFRFKTSDFAVLSLVAGTFNKLMDDLQEIVQAAENSTKALKDREETLKTYAENMKTTVDELEEVDRLKTNFLSVSSHELKTPLTPILGQLDLLMGQDQGKLTKKQQESIEMIHRNARSLQKLIEDIAISSKALRGKLVITPEPTDIQRLVQNTVDDLYTLRQQKHLKIDLNFSKNLPRAVVDAPKLAQVVRNLLHNAIKFTPEKGTITIHAKTLTVKGKKQFKITVRDTGIGIPKEKWPQLFTQFYQVDDSRTRKYGGSGLGLSICKTIIEAMGGRIWLDKSTPNKGSTFVLTIPLQVVAGEPAKHELTESEKYFIAEGLTDAEGKVSKNIKLDDLKGSLPLDHQWIITRVITEAKKVVGDTAIKRANETNFISVKSLQPLRVVVKGNPELAMNILLSTYREVLGYIMDSIENDIAREIVQRAERERGGVNF